MLLFVLPEQYVNLYSMKSIQYTSIEEMQRDKRSQQLFQLIPIEKNPTEEKTLCLQKIETHLQRDYEKSKLGLINLKFLYNGNEILTKENFHSQGLSISQPNNLLFLAFNINKSAYETLSNLSANSYF